MTDDNDEEVVIVTDEDFEHPELGDEESEAADERTA